jgi:putative ATPase
MFYKQPLAELLRPQNLDEYIGQKHLTGTESFLRRAIENGQIPSMILWGPPGTGKTTLARLIAKHLAKPFHQLSAINSGVKDVREAIKKAELSGGAILFIDEIHRFSKSQQDSLLASVEKGVITLIGATTENPSFEVISPLLSRSQVYILKAFDEKEMNLFLEKGRQFLEKDLKCKIIIREKAALMKISGGDGRKLLNALDLVVRNIAGDHKIITDQEVTKIIQNNLAVYDKGGEMHYDVISAFIKSLRGSDPNAAIYWLARMIDAGEDPKFIARRMLILASEDIGNANPTALVMANATFDAVSKIGFPESRIILSQTAIYLATSPKSNASYLAIDEALSFVRKTGNLSVPLSLRNAPSRLMKDMNYGKDYKYAHQYENNFVNIEFLPQSISGKKFFKPGNNARENSMREFLKNRWKDKYQY